MNIQITGSAHWFAAQEKATEFGDPSLNECITRLISIAMPKEYEIQSAHSAKECADKEFQRFIDLGKKWSRLADAYENAAINSATSNNRNLARHYRDLAERAKRLAWGYLYRRSRAATEHYYDILNGARTLRIFSDSPLSFGFLISRADGTNYLNGGIIYSDHTSNNRHWSIHT